MPGLSQGNAATIFSATRTVEMGSGGSLQQDASPIRPSDGKPIAAKWAGSQKSKNKQSLDYVLRTGLAGGLAGCAVLNFVYSNAHKPF